MVDIKEKDLLASGPGLFCTSCGNPVIPDSPDQYKANYLVCGCPHIGLVAISSTVGIPLHWVASKVYHVRLDKNECFVPLKYERS